MGLGITWAYLVKLMDFETKNQFFCRALEQICHLMEHAGNDPLQSGEMFMSAERR